MVVFLETRGEFVASFLYYEPFYYNWFTTHTPISPPHIGKVPPILTKKSRENLERENLEMSEMIEEMRSKAIICHGDEIGQEKSKLLLIKFGLPNGLLPLKDIEECGHVEETGFVWLKQKKKYEHKFESIGKLVSYGPIVTAFIENNRIKKLTGVKAKELLIWVTLTEIYVDDPPTGKITFKSFTGISKSFPVSAFQIEDVKKDNNE